MMLQQGRGGCWWSSFEESIELCIEASWNCRSNRCGRYRLLIVALLFPGHLDWYGSSKMELVKMMVGARRLRAGALCNTHRRSSNAKFSFSTQNPSEKKCEIQESQGQPKEKDGVFRRFRLSLQTFLVWHETEVWLNILTQAKLSLHRSVRNNIDLQAASNSNRNASRIECRS